MRCQNSECTLGTPRARAASVGRTKKWFIPLILGALLVTPQVANAYSFAGSDWLVNLSGYLNTPISALNQSISETNLPTTITQSSNSEIVIPLDITAVGLTVNVAGTVSGTHITATNHLNGPVYVTAGGFSLRLSDIDTRLEGDATSINPLDLTGGFGARVYGVTGNPTADAPPTSFITVGTVEVDLLNIGVWSDAGDASVDVYSWSATRGQGVVPEPGTLVMLLGLTASLAGYGCWKRRGSR